MCVCTLLLYITFINLFAYELVRQNLQGTPQHCPIKEPVLFSEGAKVQKNEIAGMQKIIL